MEDGGIALYSHEHKCSLATTFRSLPELDARQTNDTVLRILNLKLEASCTTSASKASSRLFLIESTARTKLPVIKEGALQKRSSEMAGVGYFRRAVDYIAARRRLGYFRTHHGHLQEVGTSIRDIEGDTRFLDLSKPDLLACSLYLSMWVLDALVHQRLPVETASSPLRLRARSQLGGMFVLSHICAYYVLGRKMLYSSRAAGLVSLYSLAEYVIEGYGQAIKCRLK